MLKFIMAQRLALIVLVFSMDCGDAVRGEWGQIKINEPRASSYGSSNSYSGSNSYSNSYGSNSYSSNSNSYSSGSSSSAYRDPNDESKNSEIALTAVVEYLKSRKGQVVEGSHTQYTYKVQLVVLYPFDYKYNSKNDYLHLILSVYLRKWSKQRIGTVGMLRYLLRSLHQI